MESPKWFKNWSSEIDKRWEKVYFARLGLNLNTEFPKHMRKILSLIALVFACGYASAQFTMSSSDFGQIGDSRTYMGMDTAGISEGSAGTGQTWDFTGGTVTSQTRILNVVTASAHPQGASFPNSTHAYDFSNGTYRFYTVGSNDMTYDGEVSLVNTPIPYDSTPIVYNFPVNLNDMVTDTIDAYYNTGAAGFAFRFGNHTTFFDAAGSLMLPGGVTYANCNRIVTFIQIKDSSQVFPLVTDIQVLRYEWYQQGVTLPVMYTETQLVAVNGGAPTQTREIWFLDTGFVAIDDAQIQAEMALAPNPAEEQVRINYELDGQSNVTIEVFSLLGEKVHVAEIGDLSAGRYQETVNTSEFARGIYFVRLHAGNAISTEKLILK